jgi:SpoIID/LytB domain protein
MRRLLVLAVLVCTLAAPAAAAAAPLFIVHGRGWGHGIGLAQYGAQGYALEERRTYDWILSHYYPGTRLGSAPVTSVRVLLAEGRSSLRVASDARFTVADAAGRTYDLSPGSVELGPALTIELGGRPRRLVDPVRFSPGERPLELAGRAYRGQLVVHVDGGRLSVVNHVGLEAYLYGVVPDEMPPSWAMEALKAQAVAARSYAVVSRPAGARFDLFADTRSQVYGGLASEEPRTNAAVDATAGQVLVYQGRVARTFFHSTSGGRTAAIEDVWSGASPVPYLVSVPDPHDDLSPHHEWGPMRYTAPQLAARLGADAPPGRLLDVTVTRNRSERAALVVAHGSLGDARLSGTGFQARLGLRSTWFTVAVLSLAGDGRVELGGTATLRGTARGVGRASLESKVGSRGWERVRDLRPAADGSFRVSVKPTRTTWYRVSSSAGRGLPHRVAVAAWIRFSDFRAGRTLAGLVRPAVAGARVAIQRLVRDRWVTVATTRTGAAGEFSVTVPLQPGAYRGLALVPGFVTGVTPAVRVVAG